MTGNSVHEQKVFVLDTNVLVHDPEAIFKFKDNEVVLPVTVIEELDKLKRFNDEVGRNARQSVRNLRKLMGQGNLHEGVRTEMGGIVRIEINHREILGEIASKLDVSIPDNRIVAVAYNLNKGETAKTDGGRNVIFVTKDGAPSIKANAFGLMVEDYENDKVRLDDFYQGWREMTVSPGELEWFKRNGFVDIPGDYIPNEYIHMRCDNDPKKTAIGRYDRARDKIVERGKAFGTAYGLTSRNLPQRIALDLLLNQDIKVVFLIGPAGTGKTLLALAAALQDVVRNEYYKKILVSRPIIPMGKDIGYLPGDKDDKLSLWMQPIRDNLSFLLSNSAIKNGTDDIKRMAYKDLESNNVLELEALTYVRGRSIMSNYGIIDEAQNLTPHEVKTIITRAGEGTKWVFTGDPEQIDHPYLDASSNGLTVSAKKMMPSALSGHVFLDKSERSDLAREALEYL